MVVPTGGSLRWKCSHNSPFCIMRLYYELMHFYLNTMNFAQKTENLITIL